MCFNGGICKMKNNIMSCHCLAQYTGIKADTPRKKINDTFKTNTCSIGQYCENKWCEIQPSVCKNSGKCWETAKGYSCNCTGKF